MMLYDNTTKLDANHDLDWLAKYIVSHPGGELPPMEDRTLWVKEEWSMPQTAEDGPWLKLCGVNIANLNGRKVRVRIETVED